MKKIEIISKTPGGLLGGSPGGLWGLWRPVGLEKLVDSMTCKLTPTTKIDLEPVLLRSGSFQHQKKAHKIVRHPKKSKKTGDNDRFDSKNAVFCAKMEEPRMAMHGPGKL